MGVGHSGGSLVKDFAFFTNIIYHNIYTIIPSLFHTSDKKYKSL